MGRELVRSVVEAFEERGVRGLEAILDRTPPTEARVEALIDAVVDARAAVPATWMVLAYLRAGLDLEHRHAASLLRALGRVRADDARLHACQAIAHLEVPARNAEQLARFLRACATGDHAFTRAWAVDAFHRLALQHPRFRAEARAALARAERDPKASVRARARHIARELG